MRGHLLGPLVRRVHRVCPADRVVVVRRRSSELVDPGRHELGRLQVIRTVEDEHLVERPVDGALRRGPVVADDVVDQRVIQDAEILDRIHQPPDMVVGVLQEPGIHLHLTGQHRLQRIGHVVPGRDLLMPSRQHRVGRNHAELLLADQDLLAQHIPTRVETTLVPVRPLDRNVVRGMGGTRRVVDEERLVRHQRLLLADPPDRPVGHVLGEVVALLRCGLRLHSRGALIDPRVVLVGLPADEAVEVLESTTASGPRVERSHRTCLPDRHLLTLTELGSRVAVLPQRQRQRCTRVRPDRTVTRCRGRQLGDDSHPTV